MKIHVLFGQRKEHYDGEFGPEVLAACDEFTADENPEGWDEELEKIKAEHVTEMAEMKVIDIEVDGDRIRKLLIGTPVIKGEIKTP
jgi:hypothetical protein